MKRVGSIILIAGVLVLAGEPARSEVTSTGRASSPWSLEVSVGSTAPRGAIGELPRRDSENGDFLLGSRELTATFGFAVGHQTLASLTTRLEVYSGEAQFGGEAFLGRGDSISIGEFDLRKATSTTLLLSILWLENPDVYREGSRKHLHFGGGPAVGFTWFDNLSESAAGSSAVGVTSARAGGGVVWGLAFDLGWRISRSRWGLGLRGSLLAGGATLQFETSPSSRWRNGSARFRPAPLGLYLGYRFP